MRCFVQLEYDTQVIPVPLASHLGREPVQNHRSAVPSAAGIIGLFMQSWQLCFSLPYCMHCPFALQTHPRAPDLVSLWQPAVSGIPGREKVNKRMAEEAEA